MTIENPSMTEVLGSLGAHLHCGMEGENGGVIAFLAPEITGGTMDTNLFYSGVITEEDILGPDFAAVGAPTPCGTTIPEIMDSLAEGNVYVNVHSLAVPSGVTRGQLARDTEASVMLFDAPLSSDMSSASGDFRFVYAAGTPGIAFYGNVMNPEGIMLAGAAGVHIHW
jgi:hypothetical protein